MHRFPSESVWDTSDREISDDKCTSLARRMDYNLRITPRVRLTNLRGRSRSPIPKEFKRLSLRKKQPGRKQQQGRKIVRLDTKDVDEDWRKGFRNNSRNAKNCPCLRLSGKKALYRRKSLKVLSFKEPERRRRRSDLIPEMSPLSDRDRHRENRPSKLKFGYDSNGSEAGDSEQEQVTPRAGSRSSRSSRNSRHRRSPAHHELDFDGFDVVYYSSGEETDLERSGESDHEYRNRGRFKNFRNSEQDTPLPDRASRRERARNPF